MNNPPLVSVVIPTYNSGPRLRRTLASVSRQTFVDFEVLVVDDCSTDRVDRFVEGFARTDSRFELLRTTRNSNLPAVPRNLGIAHSRAKYVAFLDHDDLWFRFKLARQIEALERNANVAMVHSRLIARGNFEMPSSLFNLPCRQQQTAESGNLFRYNTVHMSSVVARRSTLMKLGGFSEDTSLRAIEDYDLWLRMSRSHKIGYIPELHGRVFRSEASTSAREDMKQRREYLSSLHGLTGHPHANNNRPIRKKISCRCFGFIDHTVASPLRVALNSSPHVVL